MNISNWIEKPPASFDLRTDIILENATFQKTDSVIEVGVGMSQTTYKVAQLVHNITGVDISDGLVDYLNSRKRAKNIKFICADVGDSHSVGRLGGPYDKAISGDTLEHVENPECFFRNLAAVLKPAGALVLTFPNESAPSHGITRFGTRSQLAELILQAGFKSVEMCIVEPRPHVKALQKIFADSLIGGLRALRHSPDRNPQVFHEVWTFSARKKMEPIRHLIHAYWDLLHAAMAVSRPLYRLLPVQERILDHQILIVATR